MYVKSKLISRRGYSGFSGLGGITDFFKSILNSYGASQQQQGALTQAQLDAQAKAQAAAGGGIQFTDIAIIGAVGLAGFYLLRRKKT